MTVQLQAAAMCFLLKFSRIYYNIVPVQKSPMTNKKQSKNV
jgi:hypothetical protein